MDAKDKRIAELEALLKAALERIAELEANIAALEKNSATSSKPPSSDIVKPPKQKDKRKKKRKIGAQKGHKQHLRKPFDETQVDKVVELKLNACPVCGGTLKSTHEPPKTHQQVELVDKPFIHSGAGGGIGVREIKIQAINACDAPRTPRPLPNSTSTRRGVAWYWRRCSAKTTQA